MAVPKTKNDKAWEELFAEHNILYDISTNGLHFITASAINKKREARLMTKFDHAINRPQIFSDHNLAILPDSRSSYVIGHFDCYAKLPLNLYDTSNSIIERPFPDHIQTLSPNNLYSESAALLCAHHAGLIEDVLEENLPFSFTVFGRMSTGKFDLSINVINNNITASRSLTIDRAQCEIDGGFESTSSFVILEVKNAEVMDFHIRQLYFPYRLWRNKLNKRVIPVFLTYSNEVFTFSVYEFEDPNNYNSLQLVRRKRYQIVQTEIGVEDIRRILTNIKPQPEDLSIPFPQADRFERVIDILSSLYAVGGTLTQEAITLNNDFDVRQTQYYTSAGSYLKLIESSQQSGVGVSYNLTPLGFQLMDKAPKARNLHLIQLILSRRVFYNTMEDYLTNAQLPSRDKVVNIIKNAGLSLNPTTADRRAQTVLSWVVWMMKLTAEG